MYKIKYCLWIFGLVVCFSTGAYSADNTDTHKAVNTELMANANSCDTSIATEDCDGDGLNNGEETTGEDDPATLAVPTCKSSPNDPCDPPRMDVADVDCDGDGIDNDQEIDDGTDPANPCEPSGRLVDVDCDGDGLTNREELEATPPTDPTDPCDPISGIDCDGDGLTNDEETGGLSADDTNTPLIPQTSTDPGDKCEPGFSGNEISDDAIPLTIANDCTYYSSFCAADESDYPNSCGLNKASVWFTFTTDDAGYHEIIVTSWNTMLNEEMAARNTSFNSVLTLFDNSFGDMVCVNDDEFGFGERLYEDLDANTTYYIMVTGSEDGTGITEGVFCIDVNEATPPDNQDCSGATPIPLNTECGVTGNNRYASYANPRPLCNPYAGASVWYIFETPSGVDKVQISAVVNYSEVITVYEGICGELDEIACKLNGTDYNDDLIVSGLLESTTYYLQISGNFTSIEANNASCSEGNITVSTNPDCEALCDLPCNDYNPNTINDVWDANCNCAGECLYAGDSCDDGDPNTSNDTFDGLCNCVPCTYTPDGIDNDCDDSNPNTHTDEWDTNCNCVGICDGVLNTTCDDSNPYTVGTRWDDNCNCTGGTCQLNNAADDCPNENYVITESCMCKCLKMGTTCDDNDSNTLDDKWTANCECIGTSIDSEGDCEEEITLYGPTESGLYKSFDWIKTDGTNGAEVAVSGSLELRAGDYINLKPGFSATGSGTYFNGKIEECTPVGERTEESLFASVKHYPNPFKDEINLEFTLDFDAEVQIIISDVNGRMITHLPAQNLYTGTQTVNVSTEHWIAGVYFYQALIKQQNTGILTRATGTVVKM